MVSFDGVLYLGTLIDMRIGFLLDQYQTSLKSITFAKCVIAATHCIWKRSRLKKIGGVEIQIELIA